MKNKDGDGVLHENSLENPQEQSHQPLTADPELSRIFLTLNQLDADLKRYIYSVSDKNLFQMQAKTYEEVSKEDLISEVRSVLSELIQTEMNYRYENQNSL